MKNFCDFFSFVRDIKFECNLYEDEDNKRNANEEEGQNEFETFATAITDRFNLDKSDQIVDKNSSILSKEKSLMQKSHFNLNFSQTVYFHFTSINVSKTNLNDKAFIKAIIPLIEKTPFLQHINLSHNFLTNVVFNKFLEVKHYTIKEINLSYNKILNGNLSQEIPWLFKHFFFLEHLSLRGNFLTNSFLYKIDIKAFDEMVNEIKKITTDGRHREKSVIDMRENNFDLDIIMKKFYLWSIETHNFVLYQRNHLDEGIPTIYDEEEEIYNGMFYDSEEKKSSINKKPNEKNEKIKEDIFNDFKFAQNIEFLFDFPYLKVSKNYFDKDDHSKFSITSKSFEIKKVNQQIKESELEVYQKLFQFFFLIDYHIDPILNSYSHTKSVIMTHKKEYLNQSNEKKTFNELKSLATIKEVELKNYIDIEEKYYKLNEENPDINPIEFHLLQYEMSQEKAKEIFYLYSKLSEAKKPISFITKKLFNIDREINPNGYISDLSLFFDFLMKFKTDFEFQIPFTTLHTLINRIKIEAYLSLCDKDVQALNALQKITSKIHIQGYDSKIKRTFERLKARCEIIDEAMIKIINFSGYEKKADYLTELNNYIDIFTKEAQIINYNSDPVCITRYIQYLRNTFLRRKVSLQYEKLLIQTNNVSYVEKVNNDYDEEYKKYSTITDPYYFKIPEAVKCKELSLHPTLLDYLRIAEVNQKVLASDLEIVSKPNIEMNYGIKNIYDRITFLFLKNSVKRYPQKYGYSMSKNNDFMKVTRVLFRFFNRMDNNSYFHLNDRDQYTNIVIHVPIQESKLNIVYQVTGFNTRFYSTKTDLSILTINKLKLDLLSFTSRDLEHTMFDTKNIKGIKKDECLFYAKVSKHFYRLLRQIISSGNYSIININYICRKVKELQRFFLKTKKSVAKKNPLLFKELSKEFLFLCIKFINRERFEFSDQNEKTKYSFGVFYLVMFYLELSQGMLIYLKQFIAYLYLRRYNSGYCKKIIRALNNPYRYDYVMSSYEVTNRLESKKLPIKIFFQETISETYDIDEHTTVLDLLENVLQNSRFLSRFKEKDLYWIFIEGNSAKENNDFKDTNFYLKGNEFILRVIGQLEEKIIDYHSKKIESENKEEEEEEEEEEGATNEYESFDFGSFERDEKTDQEEEESGSLLNSNENEEPEENPEENHQKSEIRREVEEPEEEKISDSQIIYPNPTKKMEDSFFDANVFFDFFKFVVKRRIFSPNTKGSDVAFQKEEQVGIFEQLANNFYKESYSNLIPKDKCKRISMLLLVNSKLFSSIFLKNNDGNFDIEQNAKRIIPKKIQDGEEFKLSSLKELLAKEIKKTQSKGSLLREFFSIVRSTPALFSNIFTFCTVKKTSTDLISLDSKMNVILDYEMIRLQDCETGEIKLKFLYTDVIKCVLKKDNSKVVKYSFFLLDEETRDHNELKISFETQEAVFIMEDTLSYLQYYLCKNTKSSLYEAPTVKEKAAKFVKHYKLIFRRKLQLSYYDTSVVYKNIECEEEDLKNKKINNECILEYKRKKKEMQRLKEEEEKKKEEERAEKLKKLKEEEERIKGIFNIRRIFKYSPITGELNDGKHNLPPDTQSSGSESEVEIRKIDMEKVNKVKDQEREVKKEKEKIALRKSVEMKVGKGWVISEEEYEDENKEESNDKKKFNDLENSVHSFHEYTESSKSENGEKIYKRFNDKVKDALKMFSEIKFNETESDYISLKKVEKKENKSNASGGGITKRTINIK